MFCFGAVGMFALAIHFVSLTLAAGYQCYSDQDFGAVSTAKRKGLAVDDTTLQHCSSRIPWLWPNTLEEVQSIRLFRAWHADWDDAAREDAWSNLVKFVKSNYASVLMGTQITCDDDADRQDWEWSKALLRRMPASQIMGVAIGNELDLLFLKVSVDPEITKECIAELWQNGGLWRRFQDRVSDLEEMGLGKVPVTSVFTGIAMSSFPFIDQPQSMVNTFLLNATRAYGSGYAFTFNVYPYFDGGFQMNYGSGSDCSDSIAAATCWDGGCQVPATLSRAREGMRALMGTDRSLLWMGETGWSSPIAGSLHTEMSHCAGWSSQETFTKYYEGFLHWDLKWDRAEPDHVFYFDVRDSLQFGVKESFGLIETCASTTCKLKSPGYSVPYELPSVVARLWTKWALASVLSIVVLSLLAVYVHVRVLNRKAKDFFSWLPAWMQNEAEAEQATDQVRTVAGDSRRGGEGP